MIRSRVVYLGMFALVFVVLEAAPARADMAPFPCWPWSKPAPRPTPPRYLEHLGPTVAPDGEATSSVPPVTPTPQPPPAPKAEQPQQELWPNDQFVPPQPKRTGPFRSCGTGTGACLVGIALAWGMLWLGNRFVRSQRTPSARG